MGIIQFAMLYFGNRAKVGRLLLSIWTPACEPGITSIAWSDPTFRTSNTAD
jgi:hypothetical protein